MTTSTLTTCQPDSATRVHTWRSSSSDEAPRYCSSDAGKSVPRSGRPAGPSNASATAWATASASEWPRRAAPLELHAGEHQRAVFRIAVGDEGMHVVAEAHPNGHGAPSRATATRRSSGVVILRLRGSPGTTTTVPPAASTSAASSVASSPARVRGAEHRGPERLWRLHRDELPAVDGVDRHAHLRHA